jgi:tryptophanyl-tRNA synthetase
MPAKMSAAKAAAVKVIQPKIVKDKVPESGATTGDVSNFITQSKKSSNPDKVATLQLYQSLGRFDTEKKNLVAKWKLDKTCKWFSEYTHSREKEHEVKTESLLGFGTR